MSKIFRVINMAKTRYGYRTINGERRQVKITKLSGGREKVKVVNKKKGTEPHTIARGTDYKYAIGLPYRHEYWPKKDGWMGRNGIMVLDEGFTDKKKNQWSVSKRHYSKEKGGYFKTIKKNTSKSDALITARDMMK